MKRLTRADFVAVKVPSEVVQVPGLDGGVCVKGMSGVDRDIYESSLFSGKGKHRDINMRNVRAKLVVACTYDLETDERIWDDSEVDQVGALPARMLNPIFSVAQRLSGISEEEIDELGKPIEGTTPTRTATGGGSSSSGSPAN